VPPVELAAVAAPPTALLPAVELPALEPPPVVEPLVTGLSSVGASVLSAAASQRIATNLPRGKALRHTLRDWLPPSSTILLSFFRLWKKPTWPEALGTSGSSSTIAPLGMPSAAASPVRRNSFVSPQPFQFAAQDAPLMMLVAA